MFIEEKLQNIDFSQNSKIQNTLLLKLLNRRKSRVLSMDDLDMVVAAGNGVAAKIKDENIINK